MKQSLADKIWEIIRTNSLVKLSAFQSRDDVATCKINKERLSQMEHFVF